MNNDQKLQPTVDERIMKADQKFHYFWKAGNPFSQWHSSVYDLDGIQFCCAEQGMMYGKAVLFKDMQIAEQILTTTSPRKMKALGQKVRGFSEKEWKKHRVEIVYRNNVAKFCQNETMRKALLSTTGTLVEASPHDRIWGICLNEENARNTPPSKWRGLNLLGLILTRARDEIKEGMYDDFIEAAENEKVLISEI